MEFISTANRIFLFVEGLLSTNFPTTFGTYSPTYNGGIDGFLVKISPDGEKMLASTYIGTNSYDQSYLVQN